MVSQSDQSLHVQPWDDVFFVTGVEINFWVREQTKCSMAALQNFLLSAYLEAQRKFSLYCFSGFAFVSCSSVCLQLAYLPFLLSWIKMKSGLNHLKCLHPNHSCMFGIEEWELSRHLVLLSPLFALQMQRRHWEKGAGSPWPLGPVLFASAALVSLCRTEAEPGLLPALILARSPWHTFLCYN